MNVRTADAPRNVELPRQEYAGSDDVLLITRFDEALEIHRSLKLKSPRRSIRVAVDSDGKVTGSAPYEQAQEHPEMVSWDDLLRHGDLSHLDGAAHTQARRALNPLFGRDAHVWFRDEVILPGLARNLRNVLNNPDADGTPRADLVVLGKRTFIQAAAALVGFDDAQTEAGTTALVDLHARIEGNKLLVKYVPSHPKLHEYMQEVLDGRTELLESFYRPSLEKRRRLLARRRAGEVAESDLPHDLLALIASGVVPVDDQDGLGLAMQFISGATGTNTGVLTRTVANLTQWFRAHPEDRELRTDAALLEGALNESIRLHGPGPRTMPRLAIEDVTLASGRSIKAGQYVALVFDQIGRDTAVFGADADRFNPRRVVPTGVYPFGLGFGSGSHMCIGLPLVLGQGGLTGFQVPVLQALYAAGLHPDPGRPAQKIEAEAYFDEYATFPVVFDRSAQVTEKEKPR